MIVRKEDPNGDMVFGLGDNNTHYRNSPEAVAQAVMTSLKLFEGEWFLDVTAGIPYYQKILGFNNMTQFDFIIKEAILNVQGVVSLASYSSSYNSYSRKATVNAKINTEYGTTTVSAIL